MGDITERAVEKAPIAAGGALAALVPQSLDEAFRLAKALSMSGDMVPKHFQDKPEMIMAAIMRGAEIGLMPMQALSNIAVINGRASLFGDALPALMQKAGHSIDTEVVGEGDAMSAVATLIRGDTGQVIVRSFSVADAKQAGLLGKPGPWTQYRQRMLTMRARAWACRDGAADALMGLHVVEEAQDMPAKDITPKEPGFVRAAIAAREAAKPEKEEPAKVEEAQAGVADPGTVTANAVNEDGRTEQQQMAFELGADAGMDPDAARTGNPFDDNPELFKAWMDGFEVGRQEIAA